jgi:hypothetical protein
VFSLFGVFQFVVAGLAVRPPARRCFNVFCTDSPLWLQIQLIDDDQKFAGLPPQCTARTTDVLAMLEIVQTCFEKRRRLMSRYCFTAIE